MKVVALTKIPSQIFLFFLLVAGLLVSHVYAKSTLPPCVSEPMHECLLEGEWSGITFKYEMRNGEPNGWGYTNQRGIIFEGTFKDGLPSEGKTTHPDGTFYEGQFSSNTPYAREGFGEGMLKDGGRYVGQWKENKQDGYGMFYYPSGASVEGYWSEGKLHGKATYRYVGGDVFVGNYSNGKKEGYGEVTNSEESCYGNWTNGRLEVGVRNSEDGRVYEGEFKFKDCWPHGKGKERFPNGAVYEGDFEDGLAHGEGVLTASGGAIYSGEFQSEKISGRGEWLLLSGEKHSGIFLDGSLNGPGTIEFPSGDTISGEFVDNVIVGDATYLRENGDKWVGKFLGGLPTGVGLARLANGDAYPARFDRERRVIVLSETQEANNQGVADGNEWLLKGSGSGFSVSQDGHLVTNEHVISECQRITIRDRGRELPVSLVISDTLNDLALLRGDFSPRHVFSIRRNNPRLMEEVYVAGFPLGHLGDKYSSVVKITKGIVSALTGIENNFSRVQIDAAINAGNSGGPILDSIGNVVAVTVSSLKYSEGEVRDGINFGIKSSVLRNMLESQRVNVVPEIGLDADVLRLGDQIEDGTFHVSCWVAANDRSAVEEETVVEMIKSAVSE